MVDITIYGVTHIKPTLEDLIEYFEKEKTFDQKKKSLVFFEPNKNLILEKVDFFYKPTGEFSKGLKEYLLNKGAHLVPLNPRFMPSHPNPLIPIKFVWMKTAQQFGEEDYMTDVVKEFKTKYSNYESSSIIIGSAHGPKMSALLNQKGIKTRYVNKSPPVPYSTYIPLYRQAIEGKSDFYILHKWVKDIHEQLRKVMFPESAKKKAAGKKVEPFFKMVEQNTIFYKTYLKLVKKYMDKGVAVEYFTSMNPEIVKKSKEIRSETLEFLTNKKQMSDHPIIFKKEELTENL